MRHKNSAVLVDALFGSIAGPLRLKISKGQHKGEEYKVSSGRASELLNRKRNPDAQISAGADNPKVLSTVDDYFDSAVLDLLMMGDSLDVLNNELTNEIKSDVHLPESIKKELLEKSKSSNIRNDEFKYLNELCQAYSDRLGMTISIDNIDSCPKKRFRNDFNDERNYYNSVQSRIRGVREIFSDVDEQYDVLKKEAYEGIKETYLDDYPDGFKRLMEVLKKITSTSLNRSQLVKLDIIGNAERKGLCHVLVNDGYIKSWVDVDE